MAGRLANLRVLAKRARAPQANLPTRGGGGGPVKMGRAIDQPVRLSFTALLGRSKLLLFQWQCCWSNGTPC